VVESLGEVLAEGRKEVLRDFATPDVAHCFFDLIFRFGGETTDAEKVVGTDRFHGCDTEGDGFRGPDFSVQEDLALGFGEVIN
jgi:hypothetical protein